MFPIFQLVILSMQKVYGFRSVINFYVFFRLLNSFNLWASRAQKSKERGMASHFGNGNVCILGGAKNMSLSALISHNSRHSRYVRKN